jgi:hypothetical protein
MHTTATHRNGPSPEFGTGGSNGFQGQAPYPGNDGGAGVQARAVNVLSYSFSGNHLFEVSLVHQQQNEPRKKQFFCFFKLLPGGQAGGNRTYISDKHITMKLSLDRALEIAKAMRAIAGGAGERLGPFSTFTDTSKAGVQGENTHVGKKSISIFWAPAKGQGPNDGPKVMIRIKMDSQDYTFPATPYYAGSMADIIEKVAQEGISMELDRQKAVARRIAQRGMRSAA